MFPSTQSWRSALTKHSNNSLWITAVIHKSMHAQKQLQKREREKKEKVGSCYLRCGGYPTGLSPIWEVTCTWPQTLRCLWPVIKQSWVRGWCWTAATLKFPTVLWCGPAPNSSFRATRSNTEPFERSGSKAENRSNWWIPQSVLQFCLCAAAWLH